MPRHSMKRSRFTVYTTRGPQVILAYDAKGSADFFTRRGYTVESVVKGDHRLKAAGHAPYRVSRAALDEAIAELGIKLPVRIRFNSREGGTNGSHRYRTGKTYHDVMLKSYLGADKASSTLWHELTHCMQAERAEAGGKTWAAVSAEQRQYPYRSRPIEREAIRMSERMAHRKLCY